MSWCGARVYRHERVGLQGLAPAPLWGHAGQKVAACRVARFRCARDQRLVLHADQARYLRTLVRETPEHFRFALKGHRFVTHYKRLRDCADSIVRLRDQVEPLREKLASVVWQLPSNFQGTTERLEDFAQSLKQWPTVRHALELRHRSWFTDDIAKIMRANNIAVCMGDAPDFPMWKQVTSDLVYVRLHGHTRKYASSYSETSLQAWAPMCGNGSRKDEMFTCTSTTTPKATRCATRCGSRRS